MPAPVTGLDNYARQLVGSFSKKYAVTLMSCDRRAPTLCRLDGFRYYFIALAGLLFTFPSRYLFTIDHKMYLALPDSTGNFLQDVLVSKYSRTKSIGLPIFADGIITLLDWPFQTIWLISKFVTNFYKSHNELLAQRTMWFIKPSCLITPIKIILRKLYWV